jgi:hypothetical protein
VETCGAQRHMSRNPTIFLFEYSRVHRTQTLVRAVNNEEDACGAAAGATNSRCTVVWGSAATARLAANRTRGRQAL